MADTHGLQPVRTLAPGDVLVGVLDDTTNQIDPRDIRALAAVTDTVTLEQSSAAALNATVTGSTLTLIAADDGSLNANIVGIVTAQQSVPGDLLVEVSGTVLDNILAALGGAGTNLASYDSSDLAKAGDPGDDDSAGPQTLTVTSGKTLVMSNIACSSTGAARFEVKIGVAASEVTKYVAFVSESSPTFVIKCGGYEVPDTEQVIIIKKNLDKKALTSYSTISYFEK